MPTYRVYLLDGAGRIAKGEWFEAADTAEAEALARSRCEGGAMMIELWEGGAMISRQYCGERPAGPPKTG
jgi:hypothetical protein